MKNTSLTWVSGEKTPLKVYITRVFNYGTWEEWQNLKEQLKKEEIISALKEPLRGQWTKRGKAFAETLYGYKMPNSVLISYDC